MKKLVESNYQSIKDRGLITPATSFYEFNNKLEEEKQELIEAYESGYTLAFKEELSDCILVLLNMAKHFNINIEQELWKKVKINEQRSKYIEDTN